MTRDGAAHPDRARIPAGRLLWSLVEDAVVVDRGDEGGGLSVAGGGLRVEVAAPTPTAREVLRRMCLGPVALENVAGLRGSFDSWTAGGGDCTSWHEVKSLLDDLGSMVVLSLGLDGAVGPLVSLSSSACGEPRGLQVPDVDPDAPVRLRRSVRRERAGAGADVLTDVQSPFRVVLHTDQAGAIAAELARGPASARALAGRRVDLPLPFVLDVVAFLAGARLLEPESSRSVADHPRSGSEA